VGTLIDVGDKVVIPGLIENHTHQSTSLARKLGELWLSLGITSVRETGTDSYEAVERREAEAAGRRLSPRVFAAGPLNEGARVSYGISETVGTAEEAEQAVDQSSALGLDMLKSYVRQDYGVQKVIIAAAHKSGIPVSGHELYPAVANGVDQMEHVGGTSRRGFSLKISAMERSYQDVIVLVAKSGLVITPTLALHSRNGERDIKPILETVGRIAKEGGRIVAGTDSPFVEFAASLHTEMKLYVDAGLTPAQAIRAATYDGAVAIGADSEIGSIEVGKMADLVVIDGDPLTTIADTRKVDMVMKSGAIVFQKK
jgi:imidazolonepropionase-like amidohydrolase